MLLLRSIGQLNLLQLVVLIQGIWIPTILPAGEIVGQVTKAAAFETGLAIGTPVVLAAGDQSCGNLGVGICRPGMLGINGGASCALQTPSERLPIDTSMSCFVDYSPTGSYIAENGITSGTAALTEWFRDQFCLPDVASPSGNGEDSEALYNLASQAPAGNMGLMLVPYSPRSERSFVGSTGTRSAGQSNEPIMDPSTWFELYLKVLPMSHGKSWKISRFVQG